MTGRAYLDELARREAERIYRAARSAQNSGAGSSRSSVGSELSETPLRVSRSVALVTPNDGRRT